MSVYPELEFFEKIFLASAVKAISKLLSSRRLCAGVWEAFGCWYCPWRAMHGGPEKKPWNAERQKLGGPEKKTLRLQGGFLRALLLKGGPQNGVGSHGPKKKILGRSFIFYGFFSGPPCIRLFGLVLLNGLGWRGRSWLKGPSCDAGCATTYPG